MTQLLPRSPAGLRWIPASAGMTNGKAEMKLKCPYPRIQMSCGTKIMKVINGGVRSTRMYGSRNVLP